MVRHKSKLFTKYNDPILKLHKSFKCMLRWSLIAGRLPGRTANDVKNYWNTHFDKQEQSCCKRKTRKRGITCLATSPTKKDNFTIKPRPQTYNGCRWLNWQPEVGLGEVSNKDEEKYESVNNLNVFGICSQEKHSKSF